MTAEKTALETSELLKWLLGSALIGGGARMAFGLGKDITGQPSVEVSDSNMANTSVDVPVNMTPNQFKRYQASRKQFGLDKISTEKTAGPWDNALYTLGGIGGGATGWWLMSKVLRKMRNSSLDSELNRVRGELKRLTGTDHKVPDLENEEAADMESPIKTSSIKTAAVAEWLDYTADQYISLACPSEKRAGLADILANPGVSRKLPLLAGGAGLAALGVGSMVPGVRKIPNAIGGATFGTASNAASSALKPLGYGMASVLGPIAAIFLVSNLMKGYGASRDSSEERAKLKQLQKSLRRSESRQQPLINLVPRVTDGPSKADKQESESTSPNRLGLNTTYTNKDAGDRSRFVEHYLRKGLKLDPIDHAKRAFLGRNDLPPLDDAAEAGELPPPPPPQQPAQGQAPGGQPQGVTPQPQGQPAPQAGAPGAPGAQPAPAQPAPAGAPSASAYANPMLPSQNPAVPPQQAPPPAQ